jgi:hypothetical protein
VRTAFLLAFLAGCAVVQPFQFRVSGIEPGKSGAKEVEARLGPPAERIPLSNGDTTWFYPLGQAGRQTIAVQMAPGDVVRKVEERLEPEVIRWIAPGKSTTSVAREALGPPFRTKRVAGDSPREIWEYLVYDATQQKDVLILQFSPDGVLREKYQTRDSTAVGGDP